MEDKIAAQKVAEAVEEIKAHTVKGFALDCIYMHYVTGVSLVLSVSIFLIATVSCWVDAFGSTCWLCLVIPVDLVIAYASYSPYSRHCFKWRSTRYRFSQVASSTVVIIGLDAVLLALLSALIPPDFLDLASFIMGPLALFAFFLLATAYILEDDRKPLVLLFVAIALLAVLLVAFIVSPRFLSIDLEIVNALGNC